jgi:hypothetical protein
MKDGEEFTWAYQIAGHPVDESSDSEAESEALAGALAVQQPILSISAPPSTLSDPPSAPSSLLPAKVRERRRHVGLYVSSSSVTSDDDIPDIPEHSERQTAVFVATAEQDVGICISSSSDDDDISDIPEHYERQTAVFDATAEQAENFADCAICLSSFVCGQRVRMQLHCLHKFHDGCLREHYVRNAFKCPVCNHKLDATPDHSNQTPLQSPFSSNLSNAHMHHIASRRIEIEEIEDQMDRIHRDAIATARVTASTVAPLAPTPAVASQGSNHGPLRRVRRHTVSAFVAEPSVQAPGLSMAEIESLAEDNNISLFNPGIASAHLYNLNCAPSTSASQVLTASTPVPPCPDLPVPLQLSYNDPDAAPSAQAPGLSMAQQNPVFGESPTLDDLFSLDVDMPSLDTNPRATRGRGRVSRGGRGAARGRGRGRGRGSGPLLLQEPTVHRQPIPLQNYADARSESSELSESESESEHEIGAQPRTRAPKFAPGISEQEAIYFQLTTDLPYTYSRLDQKAVWLRHLAALKRQGNYQ